MSEKDRAAANNSKITIKPQQITYTTSRSSLEDTWVFELKTITPTNAAQATEKTIRHTIHIYFKYLHDRLTFDMDDSNS